MEKAASPRLRSLDQYRGYTVAGMFFVNFAGGLAAIPAIFGHHHTYCSYADTIMPQFFFAVGFAFRMTFLKRVASFGARDAYHHAIKRNLTLFVVAVVWYGLRGHYSSWETLREVGLMGLFTQRWYLPVFQTLAHIACTSLWVLPVIGARGRVRFAFMVFSAALFVLCSQLGYYNWVNLYKGVDGGPLSFMSWTIPLLLGAYAFDVLEAKGPKGAIKPLILCGALFMMVGYGLSCLNAITHSLGDPTSATGLARWFVEPPFVRPSRTVDIWTMSQRSGSITYLTFAGGLATALLALFVWLCDLRGWEWGVFRTLGQNALAAYIVHDVLIEQISPFTPRDSPFWYVALMTAVFFYLTWLIMRYLEKNKLYLKL